MFKFGKESAAPAQKGADRENSGNGWLRSHWCALALLVIVVVAFALRTVFAYGISADGEFALSGGSSAQYHLHVVESILNGTYSLTDSSVNYPIGGLSVYPPLMDFLAAGVASVLTAFGMGTAEAASAALAGINPVIGALTCIPVYLIGKEMFDKRVGVVAALLLAFLALPINTTVFSSGNPYALAAFLIAFMSYFLVRMVKAADAEDPSRKAVLVNALVAGVFLLLAALTWNGFRFVAVLLAVAMVAQIVADRLRGRDFTTVLLGYTVTMVVGVVLAAAYYMPAGLWDSVFSGPLLVAVVSLVFSYIFLALRSKPWIMTIPGLVVAFIIVAAVLAVAAPSLFEDFIFGNSIYTSSIMDEIANSYVSMSNVSSYYGWVTMWLPICYGIYSAYVYLRRDRSATRLFITVWMLVMFFAVWTSSSNAAVIGSVFAVGSAVVIVRVLEAANLREWCSSIKTAGFPGAIRKLIKPLPFASVIVAVFLIAVPGVSYAIDAGISNNSDADHYFSGNTQYVIKTGDSYPLGDVWDQFADEPKDGALATWIDYSYDAVTQAGFDSVTDTIGGGASAVAQMLTANGASGTTAAMMLRIMMSESGDYSSAFGNHSDVYSAVKGYIDDPSTAKAEIVANPTVYGNVVSDITDENAVYLASIEAITSNMNQAEIMNAYESVCDISGDSIGYILMDGSMLPLQYGDGDYFSTIAYFAGYSHDNYGASTQFYSYNTYYGYTNYTDAIYDTFLWRSMIGPSASEAGYSSSYSYLVALSVSDGSEGSAMAMPGYGLAGYKVVFWQVMYNPDDDATVSSDGWEYMNGYEAIAKQKAEGGVINYLSSIVMMEYVGTVADELEESFIAERGTVTSGGSMVDGVTVSVYTYSDVYNRYTLYSQTETINGNYTVLVPLEGEYRVTFSNGDVDLRSYTGDIPQNIDISATSVSGSIMVGDDVYDAEDMRLQLTGEAGLVGADGKVTNKADVTITDGNFRIESILPGTYTYILYGEDGTSLGTGSVTIFSGDNVGLEIRPTERTITVTVNDTLGGSFEDGAIVIATNRATGAQFQAEVVDGKAVITAVSGTYNLSMGEGAVCMSTSNVTVTSGNRTSTITAYDAHTVTATGAPAGTILMVSSGSFSTLSYTDDAGAVKFDVPYSMGTDEMQYTVYGISGDRIYHALYTGGDSVSLTGSDAVEVSGTLKDGDNGEEGTVRFISAAGEYFSFATDSEGAYTALIPSGAYTIYADNDSNMVHIGSYSTSEGDKDIDLVDGRRITYTFKYETAKSGGSTANLPFALGLITFTYNEKEYTLYTMTNSSGQARFYIPDNVESTLSINNKDGTLSNEYFTCTDMTHKVSSGTSNNSQNCTIKVYDGEDVPDNYVSQVSVKIPYDMTVSFYEDDDDVTTSYEAGQVVDLRPGQYTVTIEGSTGHYFDGTAYIYPGQTSFSGLDVEDVAIVNIDRDENSSVSIDTEEGSYHAFSGGYYFVVGHEYYLTVNGSDGKIGYAYLDLTSSVAGYTADLAPAMGDKMTVTGNVGIDADGTITVSNGDDRHQFEVTDGSYTLVLPSGWTSVDVSVEVSATIDSEDYYYAVEGTFDGLADKAVRNISAISTDAPEEETSEEDTPSFEATVSGESFANGIGSFTVEITNNSGKAVTYNVTGGDALTLVQDYSITVENGATGSLPVQAFYDANRVAPGSDGFSITVADISGDSETIDITGGADRSGASDIHAYASGQEGSEYNDRISAYQYMYAITVVNNNVYAQDVTVTVPDVSGWIVTIMDEDGKKVTGSGGTFTIGGLETTVLFVKMMLVSPGGESVQVPDVNATVSFESGPSQSLALQSHGASVTTDGMSASGSDVYNERSGVPVGIWFLVAVIVLLLVMVFWLASKRGVFARR